MSDVKATGARASIVSVSAGVSAGSAGVSAPGKLMIAGEYAVLEGAEAIVASVDRRAVVRLVDVASATSLPPEAQASFEIAQQQLGAIGAALSLDVSTLRSESGDKKLGLGSSAAAAVAATGAVFAFHGHDLNDFATRRAVMNVALDGHRAVAPGGSGADVAAAALGGFVKFRRVAEQIETSPILWPASLPIRVVWTGQEARTSTFVAKVKALKNEDPKRYDVAMGALQNAASQVLQTLAKADESGLIAAIDAHGLAMQSLGVAAGVGIVTDTLRGIADAARNLGGAAKPSGAGGGDVAIVILPDLRAVTHFEHACRDMGAELLSLSLGTAGVQVDAKR